MAKSKINLKINEYDLEEVEFLKEGSFAYIFLAKEKKTQKKRQTKNKKTQKKQYV